MRTLRVMSFNIASTLNDGEGVNHWHNQRAALNVRVIRRYAPDLIGFQEVDRGNIATYQTALGDSNAVLGPTTDESYNVFNAIYWNPEVLRLIKTGGFWLSETPERYSGSWNTGDIRAATWATFIHRPSGVTFLHVNTHLDDSSTLAKVEGCKVILSRIAHLNATQYPIILTGDFNGPAWVPSYATAVGRIPAEQYRLLITHGFVDTYLAAGNSDSERSYTYHHYQGQHYAPELPYLPARIDWILVKDGVHRIQTHTCTIVRDDEAPVYPSDHYPVLADFSFTPVDQS